MKTIFLLVLILGIAFSQTDADQAENILESLLKDAEQNLEEFKDNWKESSAVLKDTVEEWNTNLQGQTQECEQTDAMKNAAIQRKSDNENLISFISDKIKELVDKNEKLEKGRCKANKNYIQGLKNDKIMLRLIDFLRKAIEAKDSMNLVQKKQFLDTFTQFLALYRSKNTKKLLKMQTQLNQDNTQTDQTNNQTDPGLAQSPDSGDYEIDNQFDVKQRTDGEIGDEHIDDNRERITVDSFESGERRPFSEYKKDILDLLTNLEEEINKKMEVSEEDEVKAGIAAAEFQMKLEKETQEFDAELYNQVTYSSVAIRSVKEWEGKSVKCQSTLKEIQEGYDEASSVLKEAREKFQKKEEDLREEVKVFSYVLGLYSGNVKGEGFRNQLDDYIADGTYDQTYNDREVDNFEIEG